MKSTDTFKNTIDAYLKQYATTDELFADKLQNPSKNIDDCITYVLNTVQKSGCNGFDDDEIFNMAIHYYDEKNIEVGKAVTSGKVIVNHHVEITEEEKAEMKQKALDDIVAEERRKLTQKKAPTSAPIKAEVQGSLF